LVGVGEIGNGRRPREAAQEERANARDDDGAVALAERVVIEAREHVPLLHRRAEAVEERVLRAVLHHPIGARDQQLRGHDDGRGVGDDAPRDLVQAEQDAHGDRAGDQRVGVVARHALRVARE
jgi:hypothetical protein